MKKSQKTGAKFDPDAVIPQETLRVCFPEFTPRV